MNNRFVNLDIFSKKIGFYFNDKEKIGTIFGLLLTIIYIFISLLLFILYMTFTIRRKNMKVYDFVEYSEDIPMAEINPSSIYFAFGIEDPKTSNRFIDETIYYPKILFINRTKVNGKFETNNKIELEYEVCKRENFEDDYRNIYSKGEFNNSYCLKNYNVTLLGGYKFDKMSFLRIKIYPCVNNTNNSNHCKPQELIDKYIKGGYFSMFSKDIGLNPENFSYPVRNTYQDLYTTIDKSIHRDYTVYYGITKVKTDTGLFFEDLKTNQYLQFRKEVQTFYFIDEKEYYSGEEICAIDFRIDELIYNQKRTYTKIPESLSLIGGYMQLIYTIFSLLSMLTKQFIPQLKILNGIFNFNFNQKKMVMKINTIKDLNLKSSVNNTSLFFPILEKKKPFKRNKIKSSRNVSNVSKINLIGVENNDNSSVGSIFNNKKSNILLKISKKKEKEVEKTDIDDKNEKSPNNNINGSKDKQKKYIYRVGSFYPQEEIYSKKQKYNQLLEDFSDKISLNIFDYYCFKIFTKSKKNIELFYLGYSLYKKRMDIINVFTLLLLAEKKLFKVE